MKKYFLILLILGFSPSLKAQILFEKGYFIDNDNKKIDCLIKNIDWKNNPLDIKYKLSENEEPKDVGIDTIKEFEIYGKSKYKRFIVDIDRSSEDLSQLSDEKNPVFNTEKLLLKVLVEGAANLYYYEDKGVKRFFYQKNDSRIEQLVYKKYMISPSELGENNTYKQQLSNDLQCVDFSLKNFKNLDYKTNDLVGLFIKYSECNEFSHTSFEKGKTKKLVKLIFKIGIKNSSFSLHGGSSSREKIYFGSKSTFTLGAELEQILPFNNNKWAIIIEPTYQYFAAEKKTDRQLVNVEYKSIKVPIGVRHYFFINEKSKIFLNGLFVFDFSMNSHIDFELRSNLDFGVANNLALGVGYNYNNKYSIELRHDLNREVLSKYLSINSEYKSLSLVFGYSLF